MRLQSSPRNLYRFLLIILLALGLLACRTLYRAVGLLPTETPTPLPPTTTPTPFPTPTQTSTPQPTATPTEAPIVLATATLLNTPEAPPTPMPLDLQLSVFQSVWETVRDNYLYPDYNGLDWEAVHTEYQAKIEAGLTNADFYATISDMIYALGDDHSAFLSPEENADWEAEFQGGFNYVGIGVLIAPVPERNRAVILSVFPNSPAEAAGLHSRDAILSANGEAILTEDGWLKPIIRGPEGSEVTIMAQTPGEEPRQLTIIRSAIHSNQSVPHALLSSPQRKRVGYILLPTLEDSTIVDTFRAAWEDLTAKGPLDGLIIDNTQNGGGADTVLKPILGLFTSGTLGHFISHDGERPLQIRSGTDINGSQQVPLVVLIGKNTASYGEVMSGVLKDLNRAYLIGETTDGNVETLWSFDFEDGSRLWLAHEAFRPYNHPEENWEETGIIPDLEIPVQWDQFTIENDPLVQAAMAHFDDLQP